MKSLVLVTCNLTIELMTIIIYKSRSFIMKQDTVLRSLGRSGRRSEIQNRPRARGRRERQTDKSPERINLGDTLSLAPSMTLLAAIMVDGILLQASAVLEHCCHWTNIEVRFALYIVFFSVLKI